VRPTLRLAWLAIGLILVLLAAGCGNDPAAEPEASEPAEETEAATEEEAASEATEEASEGAAAPAVDLAELCEQEYADVEVPEGFSVGLVTDIGSVDDGTFNQFAYEGMQEAADCFGFETDFIETTSEADYAANIDTILSSEPAVVVTVGFLIADATLAAAEANPDVNFIGVDQFQEEYPDNYVGILFREDQGGFLAGAMAALLTESNVVGVVGGLESVPPVVRFVNGFEAGAHYIDESIQVLSVYNDSFTDPAAGASDAQQMLGEGADVIFGAGGETGSGAVRTAAEAGAWGIGVDQDEYFTTFSGGSAPASDRLATSAVKRVDLGVFENIAAAIQGEFTGGVYELTAENGGITYAPFHDADVPEDVATQLEEIRAGLADGSIETGIDPITGLPL
jgi:basic membrane protein A and related proteins